MDYNYLSFYRAAGLDRITLTVFNHPPDLGNDFSQVGKAANNVKGNPSAKPNPAIARLNFKETIAVSNPKKLTVSAVAEDKVPASNDPKIGPVQENETIAKVKAIKNIPTIPPISRPEPAVLLQLLGSVISKYPKNEIANTRKIKKKLIFNHGFVEISLRTSGLIFGIK